MGRGAVLVVGTFTVLTLMSCCVIAVVPALWKREKNDILGDYQPVVVVVMVVG